MAMPGQENTVMYQADFSAGTGTDIGAPAVLGTTLQTYTAVTPCSGANVCVSGVPTNIGTMEISFSKDMDGSTINSSNITLLNGTTSVSTTISYDGLSRSVKIAPTTVLYTVTTYTLTIGVGVKAMNGTPLSGAYIISFTTNSTVDSTGPTVMMANGDDYKLAITFSEPMAAAKATDTANWASSVLNPANYVLYTNNSPPTFVEGTNLAKYFLTNNTLATATTAGTGGPLTFKYDAAYSTVIIEGLKLLDSSLTIKGGFNIWVKNVKDISGNIIQDTAKPANVNDFGLNGAGGPVLDARNTFGMIGPGGGGMSGPPPTSALSGGAMNVTAFGGKNPSMMGFKPVNVFPMNMLGGQESLYLVDLPLTTAIPASGQIILTFPTGFDVTNATDGDPGQKWAHKDINGPGTGLVVLASVAANATARTVTITLGSVATQANDFLHLEIDRIKNTTKSSDGDLTNGITMGSGYQVDIYTKTPSSGGSLTLETLKSMPFFIKSAGSAALTGSITFKDSSNVNAAVTLSNLPVYLMSPATGPLKTLVSFSGSATGTYTFSNLPIGQYMLGSETMQTVSGTDYYIDLSPMPQSTNVAAGSNTKDLVFKAQSATNKPNLTVYITGVFVNESVDIFAGGPGNFSVKTVTLNGTFDNASPSTQTLYLPSTGTWMIGMGPAMPRGPQQAGPPAMPSWMPPKSIEVNVSGTGPSWTWKDADGAATLDASSTDGKITIGIATANKTINGHVYNPAGNAGIQNANVFAFSPLGGMGSYAQSGSDGSFTLKVMDGSYQVGAFVPGMPPSQEIPVEVKTVSSVTTIYANGTATTDLIIKIQNPESMYTISGKVTDGTNVIKDASISARRTDAPGNLGGKTDSMGKYILYVQAGTWVVGA
ncbi:MAG: Ig-like domain-containing protein, partial [Kiritimatiellota bacterium]|nr:Ig-like domain-containing protein [Kiritimatiellota bacterium]